MKKVLYLFFALSMLLAAAGLAACAPAIEKYEPLISELRDNILVAEGEKYSVGIITGRREDPFILDGAAGEMRDYTLITVVPAQTPDSVSFSATVGGVEYTGQMTPHPFKNSFSAEIAVRSFDAEIIISFSANGESETLTAKSVKTEQMITAAKAVEIAERKLDKSIAAFRDGKDYACEIFVRLIANPIDNSGGYHWYVAFVGASDQTIYAVLIDPISMEIVAIRD